MPDEAREVVFPKGVPVQMLTEETFAQSQKVLEPMATTERDLGENQSAEPVSTNAEGGLNSEAGEIKGQARQSRPIEGDNLLGQSPVDV